MEPFIVGIALCEIVQVATVYKIWRSAHLKDFAVIAHVGSIMWGVLIPASALAVITIGSAMWTLWICILSCILHYGFAKIAYWACRGCVVD